MNEALRIGHQFERSHRNARHGNAIRPARRPTPVNADENDNGLQAFSFENLSEQRRDGHLVSDESDLTHQSGGLQPFSPVNMIAFYQHRNMRIGLCALPFNFFSDKR
jgi:hypothetical protein